VLHRNIYKDENISLQIKNKPPANHFSRWQEKKCNQKGAMKRTLKGLWGLCATGS
jgi:hypothetical protein